MFRIATVKDMKRITTKKNTKKNIKSKKTKVRKQKIQKLKSQKPKAQKQKSQKSQKPKSQKSKSQKPKARKSKAQKQKTQKPRPPKVTVLLAVYNNDKDIQKAINSVINQTYKDWELIIIDDHSTDNTYKKIMELANDNNKIKVIRNNKNKGVFVSLNRGLKLSRGKYICKVDSDDYFHKNKIKIQLNHMEKNSSLILTRTNARNEKTNKLRTTTPGTMMFHQQVINDIGFFDSVRCGADSEFLDRCVKKYGGNRIYKIPKVLYYIKKRPTSLTRSKKIGIGKAPRTHYARNYKMWHRSGGNLYMPFPQKSRPFPADSIVLP